MRWGVFALVGAMVVGCSTSSEEANDASGGTSTSSVASTSTLVPAAPEAASLPFDLVALQTDGTRIVDVAGRDVLLRGANVNSLGGYWQGLAEIDANLPVTDDDWDVMAANGFSVIRLLISWSLIEPVRGEIDEAYLDEIEAMVDAAAAHGIYSVIDMHQDAYSSFIFTTNPAECVEGTQPAKGWDGAPEWATLTDGASTCLRNGDRNSSPAVEAAWTNFYRNSNGIADHFVAAWAAVAERFAGRAEVAGYDLLNEPENPLPSGELQPIYGELMRDTIEAVRTAERDAGADFEHIVFVEPALPAGDFSRGLASPSAAMFAGMSNVAVSVHNYMEAINNFISLEALNDTTQAMSDGLGVPNWGGEYGFWDTEADTLTVARRYAADEDAHRWGGAWWQWRQSCGDPHSVKWENGSLTTSEARTVHLNILECPANTDAGPNAEFLSIVGRSYPRATPGELLELISDPATGALSLTGSDAAVGAAPLIVWAPSVADDLTVETTGLGKVEEYKVDGGRYLVATPTGSGEYTLHLE